MTIAPELVKYHSMAKAKIAEGLSNEIAKGVLADCLEDGVIIQGRHFRDEMAAEGLCFEDIWYVLRCGKIADAAELDIKTGEWKYKVEGYEPGSRWLAVVFSFKQIDTVFLITVYSVESRRRDA